MVEDEKEFIKANEEILKRHEITFLKLRISELEDEVSWLKSQLNDIEISREYYKVEINDGEEV